MKNCPKCGETKPLEEFYRCKSRGDGRTGRCRVCHDAAVKMTRSKAPKKYREIARRTNRKRYERTVVVSRAKWAAIAAEAAAEA